MRIELTTKSGLTLTGELKAGGSIIELRVYEPTTELVQALQQHRISFSIHAKLIYSTDYVSVCISDDKVESFLIEEDEQ
jgi:hypothetical protein